MSSARTAPEFIWSEAPEPHAERRRRMLEAHPEIKRLYGPCPRTKYVCTVLVVVQIATAYALRDAPIWLIVLVAYAFGGTINQSLFLAIHELSHNLAFKAPWKNRLFALFVNLPAGVPVAATFRYYHLLHHVHQGEAPLDTDLPTRFEARWVKGPWRKTLWVFLQGFAYGLRPLFVYPKRPDAWEIANLLVQMSFNVAVYWAWGPRAFWYLPLGSLLAMGLHPIAGHYISEHYVFRKGQETYSYYGPLNLLAFNVGYHNEHHDFPYIPGSRLPRLRALAPEFYDGLMHHRSWTATIWQYITRPEVSGASRVRRDVRSEAARAA